MTGDGKAPSHPSGGAAAGTAAASLTDSERAERTGRAKARPALSELTRARLSIQLRAMYETVAQQPVPDRFADLIARLDAAERDKA